MNVIYLGLLSILLLLILTFYQSFVWGWISALVVFLVGSYLWFPIFFSDHTTLWIVLAGTTILFLLVPLQRILFANLLMSIMAKVLPPIGGNRAH